MIAAPAVVSFPRFGGGVHAVVSTRSSGNLSLAVGDQPEQVVERRRALCSQAGIELDDLVYAEQVHGGAVFRAGSADRGRVVPGVDALIADTPGLVLLLTFADCVPVFLVDPDRPAVGLAHAGWRGTAAALAARMVEAMRAAFGSEPARLRAALGPAIGPCCYEVSPEVAEAVGHWRAGPIGRPHADLPDANRAQLLAAGLIPVHVELADACTSCQIDRYFSHRAERGRAGRHVALLGLKR